MSRSSYDPNQPRGANGEWVGGGIGARMQAELKRRSAASGVSVEQMRKNAADVFGNLNRNGSVVKNPLNTAGPGRLRAILSRNAKSNKIR